MKSRLAQDGAEPLTSTPEQYGAYFRSELARWSKQVQSAGLSAQ
jgi:tripartite-type tricarboxylate transporter receptor subunit TctC